VGHESTRHVLVMKTYHLPQEDEPTSRTPVIIDSGSGYTKMGIAASSGPAHVVPTILYRGERDVSSDLCRSGIFPLESSYGPNPLTVIGNAAVKESISDVSGSTKPIVDGRVNDWSDFEQYMFCCYTQYLKVDPSDRPCVLTEPPLNPASNREKLAEIMFETFGVPSMYIGVQAVLALYAYWDGKSSMTGTVIDSGDGVTHVIPVTDGYVSGSSVREIPIAGKDVTRIVSEYLVARKEVLVDSPESAVALDRLSKQVKENLTYVCRDVMEEFKLYDASESLFKKIEWIDPRTKQSRECEIGYERFMAPEVFFRPELVGNGIRSLPEIVHDSVQASPIDYRKNLLSNIVLSGGSTMFPNFAPRLELELRNSLPNGSSLKVNVNGESDIQRFAVWQGAAALCQTPGFDKHMFTKAQYDEIGPRVARDTTITRCLGL
jgi:actin-related protein 3